MRKGQTESMKRTEWRTAKHREQNCMHELISVIGPVNLNKCK